jgi:hypothetical protein
MWRKLVSGEVIISVYRRIVLRHGLEDVLIYRARGSFLAIRRSILRILSTLQLRVDEESLI